MACTGGGVGLGIAPNVTGHPAEEAGHAPPLGAGTTGMAVLGEGYGAGDTALSVISALVCTGRGRRRQRRRRRRLGGALQRRVGGWPRRPRRGCGYWCCG